MFIIKIPVFGFESFPDFSADDEFGIGPDETRRRLNSTIVRSDRDGVAEINVQIG